MTNSTTDSHHTVDTVQLNTVGFVILSSCILILLISIGCCYRYYQNIRLSDEEKAEIQRQQSQNDNRIQNSELAASVVPLSTLPSDFAYPPPIKNAIRIKDSGLPGVICRSVDSGKTWESIKLPTNSYLVAAKSPSTGILYLLGSCGNSFFSTDYGLTWQSDPYINEENFHTV